MAVRKELITLKTRRSKVLHRSVGKKFSIEIETINNIPVAEFGGGVPAFLHKMIGGVAPTLDRATNFQFMPGSECVPIGSIRGRLRENLGTDEAIVGYTVRTGSSVQ